MNSNSKGTGAIGHPQAKNMTLDINFIPHAKIKTDYRLKYKM